MRRAGLPIAVSILLTIWLASFGQPKSAEAADLGKMIDGSSMGLTTSATPKAALDDGKIPAMTRVMRTVMGEEGEHSEAYDIEYDGTELRTTVTHRDSQGGADRSDSFFNVDGTLSFVRMRDARGNTRTVHFVYDSNGNPVERIESQDDVPLQKTEFKYDRKNEYRRDLIRYNWDGGKWKAAEGHSLVLFVNAAGIPTAFEDNAPEGKRTVVFEYMQGGDSLDNYVDTQASMDGDENSINGLITYRDGRPGELVVRSDGEDEKEMRVIAEWKIDPASGEERLVAEIVSSCSGGECSDVERRSYSYERLDSQPMVPPPSIVLPFLNLGSSLFYVEDPKILLGKEGAGASFLD